MITETYHQLSEKTIYDIFIGDYHIVKGENAVLRTILGPCVALCLADEKNGVYGMNHFMLPGDKTEQNPKFGYFLSESLIGGMLKKGADKRLLQAKVFGAGNIININRKNGPSDQNANFIEKYLRELKIPIIEKDLGGRFNRKVSFHTSTGEVVLHKRVPFLHKV